MSLKWTSPRYESNDTDAGIYVAVYLYQERWEWVATVRRGLQTKNGSEASSRAAKAAAERAVEAMKKENKR